MHDTWKSCLHAWKDEVESWDAARLIEAEWMQVCAWSKVLPCQMRHTAADSILMMMMMMILV